MAICDRKQVEHDATATQDAKDLLTVWDHLKALFEPSSLAREAALLETFYLIRRKDNEEVDSFNARVEKAADDLAGAADDLKPADRNKAYLLINRIGKEYEHQVQAIYQWQTADFTFEKVSKALLAEANRRRLAAESEKAMESTMNYYMYQKSSKQQSTSPSSQQDVSQSSSSKPNSESLVCFNCGGPGHYARDCTASKVPREGQQSRERGRERGRADDVYENKHLKVDETKVYKDVVDTYLGDSPLDISNGSETHSFNPNESSDDSDDDSSSPASVEAPIIPPAAPLTTQAPSGVTTRKKPTQPVPIPPFKSRSKVERAPVPGKSGWIREQVQRQSGATAGQWDVYFYPPGQQVKLRSRPEVRSYCENELNEPYVAADYD
uniref:CCHC-type domain-containing protein n=1 Tax=Strigamia maritima TaxID=126957 RepID=T1IK71_STRMM